MEYNTIIQFITSVGFPIAATCAMAWYVKYTTDQHREEVSKLNEQHRNELEQVTEALNNNTIALKELCAKIGE